LTCIIILWQTARMQTDYTQLCAMLSALVEGEDHTVPNMANAAALLWQQLPDINWAGFYTMEDGYLLLGPFQGKPACIRIPAGKGVCGTAAQQDKTQLIQNVHEFPGHIACDSASNSEIVVPLHNSSGAVIGVLDIDSPLLSRFTESDQTGLEQFARIIEKSCLR